MERQELERVLGERAGARCELCGASEGLRAYVVPPRQASPETSVLVCGTCAAQLAGDAALDPTHWFCLKEAIWSEVPAVQVVGLRVLARLEGASWASELRAQVYVPDEVQAWADAVPTAGADADADTEAPTLDSHGARLATGDAEDALLAASGDGAWKAEELVARYCAALYARLGTYEAVAERVGLDRRTVKRHVLAARG